MQIHLRLKMKLGDSKGRRNPMANALCYYCPDSCQEAESLLMEA
jgi:hypothetical protein